MLLLVSAALTFHVPAAPAGVRFPAPGKIAAAQGTVSFWSKPSGGELFELTPAEPLQPGDVCLRLYYKEGLLRFQVRERNVRDYFGEAVPLKPTPDEWVHLAVTWSELTGAALYVNGGRRAAVVGPLYLRSGLDSFAFPSGAVEEVRIYSGPLDAQGVMQLARRQTPPLPQANPPPPDPGRYGWHAAANVPHGSRFRVKKVEIDDARAINRFWWKLVDGKRDTVWPAVPLGWRYRDEENDYEISPVAEPFNVVRTTGDAEAAIELGDGLTAPRLGGYELSYFDFKNPLPIEDVKVKVRNGTLAELACLRVESLAEGEAPSGALHLPSAGEAAVRGVRVELDANVGDYFYLAVLDPDDESRRIVEFDVRANSPRLVVELTFTPYLIAPGQRMRVESSSPVRQTIWLGAGVEASRAAHLARRKREMRDRFQSSPALAPLAAWTEPPPPDGVPRWAWQQVKLVARIKEMADWWIDFRQTATGEFGNGFEADAELIRILPVVARLDGKVERYRRSTRMLFDWLLREQYFAAARAVTGPALELDRASPRLAEAAMELARAGKTVPLLSRLPAVQDVETAQGGMWRRLEERFEWLTVGEPQRPEYEAPALESIRLGPRRDVTWENTGGELAAIVDEGTDEGLRLRVFALSAFARRIRMGVWRLPHGEYDLKIGRDEPRRVILKPPAFVELDLPARQVVNVELKLRRRRTPLEAMPDLALDAQEIASDGRGLAVPIHNLGPAAAGPFRVYVTTPDGEALAEASFRGLEAPVDLRPKILLARFSELSAIPGLRVEVRLESGEDALDSNNAVELAPAKTKP